MDPFGALVSIAHIVNRAYKLYTACQAAGGEIMLAAEHVHTMATVLEGVKSDLVDNRNAFIHKQVAVARTRKQALNRLVDHCGGTLERMEGVVAKNRGGKKGDVAVRDKLKWVKEGKMEFAECKADLVLCTVMLDMFLTKEGVSVLYKVEAMVEGLVKRFEALEVVAPSNRGNGRTGLSPRSGWNVGRALVVSLVVARLKKVLRSYRQRKMGFTTAPWRPKIVTRVSSGFGRNHRRDSMLLAHATKVANASMSTPGSIRPQRARPQRARTPSPDFHYIPSGTAKMDVTPSRPPRRSNSMQHLVKKINAQAAKSRPQNEHYECWRVGTGSLAIGLKVAPQYLQHKRGQMQLRKMAAVFKEAQQYDTTGLALNERDARVKMLLEERNKQEKQKGGKRRWHYVVGRVERRDSGRSGMVVVEKAMVVVVRR